MNTTNSGVVIYLQWCIFTHFSIHISQKTNKQTNKECVLCLKSRGCQIFNWPETVVLCWTVKYTVFEGRQGPQRSDFGVDIHLDFSLKCLWSHRANRRKPSWHHQKLYICPKFKLKEPQVALYSNWGIFRKNVDVRVDVFTAFQCSSCSVHPEYPQMGPNVPLSALIMSE